MATYLDMYAATRHAKGSTAADARDAARKLNTEVSVVALVKSVLANTR